MVNGCRLFKQRRNLPARHCVAGVQAVLALLEPTCLTLCYRDSGCLRGVGTYLLALCCGDEGSLSSVATYLPALCCRGAGCLSGVRTYLPGTVLQGCRLF